MRICQDVPSMRRKGGVLIIEYFFEEHIAFHSWRVPRDRTAIRKFLRTFIAVETPYLHVINAGNNSRAREMICRNADRERHARVFLIKYTPVWVIAIDQR